MFHKQHLTHIFYEKTNSQFHSCSHFSNSLNYWGGGKDFKDQKWKTLNTFIVNWTLNALGDYIKVHWTERDGGGGSKKITLTMPASTNVPFETKVEFTITTDDDDLGHQMVQFTDAISQIYSTGWISWKMKSL